MRYQMDSQNAGELESSSYVALDRDPISNPAIFIDCSDLPSLTRQEFADECDINKLMAQYEKTGILPANLNAAQPQYIDVSDIPNLAEAHEILQAATTAFMRLPAVTRREFDNDPIRFVNFASDPENLEKLREWKLAPPAPVEPPPQKVEVINASPPKASPEA